ncbi:MAG: hypothetical protein IH624_03260 [Phycisphaerae bacterium]|nr:hypothetical protein [Phycisphaerae bacterium]
MKRGEGCFSVVVLMVLGGVALGGLTPVFKYSFPASYDNTSTLLIDLSPAGNDGLIDTRAVLGGYLPGQVPPGFSGGSLTGASGGHGQTNATFLLSNSAIAAAGGFTMDVWFLWEGTYTNTRKLIDYAGTENLQTNGGRLLFVFNASIADHSLAYPIQGQKWYHCIAEFDTGDNTVVDGALTGTARLWIDDLSGEGLQLVASREITKSSYGDGFNRPIGINRWAGGGGDWNQGRIFNPALYLGVTDSAAMNPRPMDNQTVVKDSTLSWQVRDLYEVSGFDVYFDPNESKVAAGDASVLAVEDWAEAAYTLGAPLLPDTLYYWRVDSREPNAPGADIIHRGEVWSFRSAPDTPYVTAHPRNQTVPAGAAAVFAVAGENQTVYTWYRSLDAAVDTPDDDVAVGGNADTLTIGTVGPNHEGYYYCVLSNPAGSDVSRTAVLAIEKLVARWQFEGDLSEPVGGFDGVKFGEPNYIDGSIAGGQAILLDGLSAVEIPYTDKLNTDSFTVTAWVKPTPTGAYQAVVSSRDDAPAKGYILYVNPNGQWAFWTGNTGWSNVGSPAVTFDAWSHLAITFDAAEIADSGAVTGVRTLYLNGVVAASGETTMLLNPRRSLLIGAGENETVTHNFFLVGQIDDVQYYNYALDPFDVAGMYTAIVTDAPICVMNPMYDVSGPDGTPDCKVDLHDLAALAGQWLACNRLPVEFCY